MTAPTAFSPESTDDLLKAAVIYSEGAVIKDGFHVPYKDSLGNWSVGYGHNLETAPRSPTLGNLHRRLSEAEALQLLAEDKAVARRAVARNFPILHMNRDFYPTQYVALVELVFNLGVAGLVTGWPRFTAAVKRLDFDTAVRELESNRVYRSQVRDRRVNHLSALLKGRADHLNIA